MCVCLCLCNSLRVQVSANQAQMWQSHRPRSAKMAGNVWPVPTALRGSPWVHIQLSVSANALQTTPDMPAKQVSHLPVFCCALVWCLMVLQPNFCFPVYFVLLLLLKFQHQAFPMHSPDVCIVILHVWMGSYWRGQGEKASHTTRCNWATNITRFSFELVLFGYNNLSHGLT